MTVEPQRLSELVELRFDAALLEDSGRIREIGDGLRRRAGYILRGVVDANALPKIIEYLKTIGRHSLPAYEPLVEGARDFHRIVRADPRSYVSSVMHQFSFHPWNQNVFDLFTLMRPIFELKNLVGGFGRDQFLGNTPRDPFIARIAFLHYPRGGGMMATHADPVGGHQLAVPVLQLSHRGHGYQTGGAFVVGADGERIDIEGRMRPGDVFLMNGEVMHGVAPIDAHVPLDWLSFEGRWVMLAAVIRTAANTTAADALQVDR